ncbi:MAG: hypothetical protein ACM3UT_09990 [Chloroflexota bacterium]
MKKIVFLLTFLITVSLASAQKDTKEKNQVGGNKAQSSEETKKTQETRFQAGASGVKRSIAYKFSSSVSGTPAYGSFRFDNNTVGKVTYLIVNVRDMTGDDQSKWFRTWDDTTGAMARGQITLVEQDGKNVDVFDVSGLFTDGNGFWRIPVKFISGSMPEEGATYYYIFERIDHKKDQVVAQVVQPEIKIPEEPRPPVVEVKPAGEPKPLVVEVKPAEEPKPPVVEVKPAEEPKPPVVEVKPAEEPKPPVVEVKPAEEPKPPVVEVKPAEEPKPPVVEVKPANEPKPPVVEIKPAEEPKPPVVEVKPAEEPKPPVVEVKPAEEPKPPVVEVKPAEEPKPPVVEVKPAEEPKPPVVEIKPAEEPKPPVVEVKPAEEPKPVTRQYEAEAVSRKQSASETQTTRVTQTNETGVQQKQTQSAQPVQTATQPAPRTGTTWSSQVTQGAQPEQNGVAPQSYQSNLPNYQYRYSSDKRGRGKWYAGIIEVGYGLGVGEYGMDNFRFNFINGFHIGQTFSLGLGLGIRRYYTEHENFSDYSLVSGKVQVPVFLDIRKTFSTRKVTPYLALGLGNSARFNSSSTADSTETVYEGLLFNPSGGIWFNISSRFAVFFGVAYEMQKMEFLLLSDDSRFKKNTGSVSLNLGIAF